MDTASIAAMVATVVVALIASIPSLIVIKRDRRKVVAESDSFVVDAARSLVEPLRQRIAELERLVQEQAKRLAEQEKRIQELEHVAVQACDGAALLTLQLQSLRQVPNWTMPTVVEAWQAGRR